MKLNFYEILFSFKIFSFCIKYENLQQWTKKKSQLQLGILILHFHHFLTWMVFIFFHHCLDYSSHKLHRHSFKTKKKKQNSIQDKFVWLFFLMFFKMMIVTKWFYLHFIFSLWRKLKTRSLEKKLTVKKKRKIKLSKIYNARILFIWIILITKEYYIVTVVINSLVNCIFWLKIL